MPVPPKESLADHFARIEETWSPRVVAALNGQEVRLAKIQGEFVWHSHAEEDELFLVIEGSLRLLFRDGEVALGPGELCVVPRGVEHKPVAAEECRILLFEPASTVKTGDSDQSP